MDKLLNPPLIWFVIGFVLFLLEFAVPGLILFFFAIGAWVVAILTLFMDLSINSQLLIFLGTSLFTVALFRKWVKRIIESRKQSSAFIDDEFIGKTGRVEIPIAPGRNGKISFRGASWDACSEENIGEGEQVTIIGNKSIVLIVKSTKTT